MKKLMTVAFLLLVTNLNISTAQVPEKFQKRIDNGEFTKAQQLMRTELATNLNLTPQSRESIAFEIERLERIKKDFRLSKSDVLKYIRQYIPEVADKDIQAWEQEKSLECMIIDGEKKYFQWAGPNLFRINKQAKEIKRKKESQKPASPSIFNRTDDVQNIISTATKSGMKFINPTRFKITYTVWVDKNAAPEGKVIRCWLPYPRHIPQRQTDIQLISCDPVRHIIADNDEFLQRAIYLERPAEADKRTQFQVVFEYTGHAVYTEMKPEIITPAAMTDELSPYVRQHAPHVVFSPQLTALNSQIIGDEKNPYRIAQKLFQWVDDNIPWASAREYSTFTNISDYVYQNRHGDCGMKAMFFMNLCRMNAIPIRWQSGWRTEPGSEGMHDWGEIYFEPYGWLPVDVDNGLTASGDENVKWFFLGGMDSYRLIVNDDYSRPLYPAKIYPRSETIDFQRGEVEWEGGNLYFDQWDYSFNVEIIEAN